MHMCIFFFTCASAKIILIQPCDEMRQVFLPSLASYYERTRTRVGTHEDGATRGSQSLSRCAGGETSLVLDLLPRCKGGETARRSRCPDLGPAANSNKTRSVDFFFCKDTQLRKSTDISRFETSSKPQILKKT